MNLTDLLGRREVELGEAALARAHAIADPCEVPDPAYAIGLRRAVRVAVAYGIEGIGASRVDSLAVPEALLAQARAAARNGVGLDVVLRRYAAGYALLGDFSIRGAGEARVGNESLARSLQVLAALFDRLLVSISKEHAEEAERHSLTAAQRRIGQVRRLLAGEPVSSAELDYRLAGWHLGAVAAGPGPQEALRAAAASLASSLLLVPADGEEVWAWLGWGSRPGAGEGMRAIAERLPAEASLGLGEPGHGLGGWRTTHRQAAAAMAVVNNSRQRCVSYADVALQAAALRDHLLANSLRDIYLAPLEAEPGGALLRQTLDAYFAAERNVSSAAAALGVTRQTVSSRLRAVEKRIERPLSSCSAELELCLRIGRLTER